MKILAGCVRGLAVWQYALLSAGWARSRPSVRFMRGSAASRQCDRDWLLAGDGGTDGGDRSATGCPQPLWTGDVSGTGFVRLSCAGNGSEYADVDRRDNNRHQDLTADAALICSVTG